MSTRHWVVRALRNAAIIVALLAALVLGHPWIFGFPGRAQEWGFAIGLHKGMTRQQVLWWADKTGNAAFTEKNGNVDVVGWDFATVCVGSGKQWIIQFDDAGRVALWNVTGHADAC